MIAYILLTGVKPFNGSSDQEVFRKIKAGTPPYNDINWLNISDEAKNFVQELLTVDPLERPSAEDALKHPWIMDNGYVMLDRQAVVDSLCHLRSFRQGHEFKRASYAFIGSQLLT